VFAEGSDADRLLGNGWSGLEPTGVWTVGEAAVLILKLPATEADVDVVLGLTAFVTPDHPQLEVGASALAARVAHVFRYPKVHDRLRVPLPQAARDASGRAALELHLHEPARPVDLGLGGDLRPLGVHLRSLTVRRTGWRGRLPDAARDVAARFLKRVM
jgi:hypothetical protein